MYKVFRTITDKIPRSKILYLTLRLLGAIQVLCLCFDLQSSSSDKNQNKSEGFGWKLLKFFAGTEMLKKESSLRTIGYFQGLTFIIQTTSFIIIVTTSGEKKPRIRSSIGKDQIWEGFRRKGIQFFALFLFLFRTVLAYRFLQVNFSQSVCWKESPFLGVRGGVDVCYSRKNLSRYAGLFVSLFLMVIRLVTSHLLVFSSDPFSDIPFSSFLNSLWVFELLKTCGIPLLSIVDSEVRKRKKENDAIDTWDF